MVVDGQSKVWMYLRRLIQWDQPALQHETQRCIGEMFMGSAQRGGGGLPPDELKSGEEVSLLRSGRGEGVVDWLRNYLVGNRLRSRLAKTNNEACLEACG